MDPRNTLYFALVCSLINVGHSYFSITSFEDCDLNTDYTIKLDGSFKTIDKRQYVNLNLTTPVPIDNMLKINLNVEALSEETSKPIPLLSGIEADACTIIHKYLEKFVIGMERQVNLEPGVCPIPQGVYVINEYLLDYEKIPVLQTFPFGVLRAVVKTTNRKTDNTLFCKIITLVNVSK